MDTERLLALSDDIEHVAVGFSSMADQVAAIAVAATDSGGDRYQDATYLATNRNLAILADRLVAEIGRIRDLLRETTGAYDETESDNQARINSSGAALSGEGGA